MTCDNKNKTYASDGMVYIDVENVKKLKRKAKRAQEHLSTYLFGVCYQECMEELGLWEVV